MIGLYSNKKRKLTDFAKTWPIKPKSVSIVEKEPQALLPIGNPIVKKTLLYSL